MSKLILFDLDDPLVLHLEIDRGNEFLRYWTIVEQSAEHFFAFKPVLLRMQTHLKVFIST